MKVYTYDYEAATVVERECEVFGYPHRDSAGAIQYSNRHFRTPREAWDKLIAELEAGLSLGASARNDARTRLERVTGELADAAERLVKAKSGLEDFTRSVEQ